MTMMMMILVQEMFDVTLLVEGPTRRTSVLVNFIVLLTYPTNFFIYCAMSTQFRATFRGMFTTCRRTNDTAPSASGNGQAMLMVQVNTMTGGSQL